ncbi:MAG: Demethylrebeccamycin-D-glucose O-methyltransferase [Syntrophaceae bacterium PtaU1.Bin231]|nr:MAG: Demethylrebeccamycin-D-glucose O-methyltransferase [Syntrophaceae bacterium PtaU1.Bin231]
MSLLTKCRDGLLFRGRHVCPRWLCFTFDNVFRRLLHDPEALLAPYVREGDTVIDVGPGIGFFTIPLAERVGDSGTVIAVDIQQAMLDALRRRALRRGVSSRIVTHLATEASLGISAEADFILAFWMAHEVPDRKRFFAELRRLLKPQGIFLLAEPGIHVPASMFDRIVAAAVAAGFGVRSRPRIALSRAVVLAAEPLQE